MMNGTFEKRCQELSEMLDDLGDSEKKFLLWQLLEYYKEGLERDMKFVVKDARDAMVMMCMGRHKNACEEIGRIIVEEIF